jgi:asparagine synthase (glutamine-hydrolysing)
MCGIAGLATKDSAESYRPAAARMAKAMSHRGPDSQGVEVLGECILVSARLAILDLSERGRMPMSNADGTVWITYNGEVYNAAELREILLQRGYRFKSTSDTEVVLHLYEEFGEDCVQHLRGMFAFAIWDGRTRKLVLARDRMGIKPLYLARSGDKLLFASEIKTLLASDLVERRLDPAGLRVYLQLGHVPPPWTIVRGITPLNPGHVATWQDGEWKERAYWTLESPSGPSAAPAEGELAEQLGDVLLEATREHLVSDVPIVLFLSGGADSACLGALAQRAGGGNLSAMTVGFAETEFDETGPARRTAQELGLPINVVTIGPDQVTAGLDHAIWAMDQPTVDGLNSYWISKLAADAGYKVALSGQGADELFGGYTSLAWFERFVNIGRWTSSLPAAPFSYLFDRENLSFRWRKMSYLFGGDAFVASQMAVKVLFLESDLHRLLLPSLCNGGRPSEAERHLSYWAGQVQGRGLMEKLAYMDVESHLQPRLLRDLDAMSMAHSIEVRPVFLDHRLIEFLLRVPAPVRMQQKRLLFDAAKRFLPEHLLTDLEARPKRTFTFPLSQWISQGMRPLVEETFSAGQLASNGILQAGAVKALWQRYEKLPSQVGWSRIWDLFVLVRWCEMMGVRP